MHSDKPAGAFQDSWTTKTAANLRVGDRLVWNDESHTVRTVTQEGDAVQVQYGERAYMTFPSRRRLNVYTGR